MIKFKFKNSTLLVLFILIVLILDVLNVPTYMQTMHLDFHNVSYYLSAIITGLITFSAMLFIDEQNAKRLQKEAFQKFKNEKALEFYAVLNDFCINPKENDKPNEEKVNIIMSQSQHYEPILKDFLEQEDIDILKDRHLYINLMSVADGDGWVSLTSFNEDVFEGIKNVKNKLFQRIFT